MLLCVCSRCLIYKVHAAVQRAFILPKLGLFVKNFFRLHRVFSKPLRLVLAAVALADSLFRVPHSFASVKHLFSFFRTFSFDSRTSDPCPIPKEWGCRLVDSSIILPRCSRVVKHSSPIFLLFLFSPNFTSFLLLRLMSPTKWRRQKAAPHICAERLFPIESKLRETNLSKRSNYLSQPS